jgi:hypothetical protein
MSEEIIVYWAPASFPNLQGRFALFNLNPQPIINDFVKRKNKNSKAEESYQSCTAFREEFKNTYYINYPVSTKININDFGIIDKSCEDSPWYIDRPSSFENSYALDLDIGLLFFSEHPLKIKFSPPFMHKNKSSNFGFIMSAAYDISSWFRAYMFTHQLWPGVNSFETVEGEPALYVSFDTDKKIIFKQFVVTDKLFEYSIACVNYKNIKPFVPFSELYYKFKNGNMHKMVLNEIKKNLVE